MPTGHVTIETVLSREEMKPVNFPPYLHSTVLQLTKRLGHFTSQRLITLIVLQDSVMFRRKFCRKKARFSNHNIMKYHILIDIFMNFPFRPQSPSCFAEQND